ncbi:hypothetical protein L873DRAFT_1651009, partial [Choiromyces venosus 120613-1]
LGSCGTDNSESDFVAALSRVLFDAVGVANSNNNPYCSQKAFVGGGGVTIAVVDRSPVCKEYDLDLSPTAFGLIGE